MEKIKSICVVGAGNMGHQIAMQFAMHGFIVVCTDISAEMLDKGKAFSDSWVGKQVRKGRLTAEEGEIMLARLSFTSDLSAAAGGADLVVEAIVESLDLKRELFKQLDGICPPHTILASNSSYIVSSKIATATRRPEKVLNMHFFNPALVMKLVEVVKGPHVSDETATAVLQVVRAIDKVPTLVRREIYGFVANRIFSAIMREACFMLEQGVASIEDIDNAVKNGLGHPLGPFQLLDLTGIDLEYRVLMERYNETGDHRDKPGPAIVERYAKGQYGRKSGKGFYSYEKQSG
jgi:3-hydroxybutyryl-CoA dehydrogenase